jgi:hypothetical protein
MTIRIRAVVVLCLAVFPGAAFGQAKGDSPSQLLLGSWVVARVLSGGPVAALTSGEASRLIGRKITYRESEFIVDGATFPISEYQRRIVTQEEFLIENKFPATKINIGSAHIVEVSAQSTHEYLAEKFGASIWFVGKDTLVAPYMGVPFELKRSNK